jgi:hypothetical protein
MNFRAEFVSNWLVVPVGVALVAMDVVVFIFGFLVLFLNGLIAWVASFWSLCGANLFYAMCLWF